jgi:hypothetical protein
MKYHCNRAPAAQLERLFELPDSLMTVTELFSPGFQIRRRPGPGAGYVSFVFCLTEGGRGPAFLRVKL